MKKDYSIPMSQFPFYGTGIISDDQHIRLELEKIFEPIKNTLIFFEHFPPHVSVRYLGYEDEVPHEQISLLIPHLKICYQTYLPITVVTTDLVLSWHKTDNPHRNKRIMLSVESPSLTQLHTELVKMTSDFPLFKGVEGDAYRPHISIAKIVNPNEEKIQKVEDFIKTIRVPPLKMTFNQAYIATSSQGLTRL